MRRSRVPEIEVHSKSARLTLDLCAKSADAVLNGLVKPTSSENNENDPSSESSTSFSVAMPYSWAMVGNAVRDLWHKRDLRQRRMNNL